MTFRTWKGFDALFSSSESWTPVGVPQQGDTLLIGSGTATLRNTVLDRVSVLLTGTPSTHPTLSIANVIVGSGAAITTANHTGDLNQFVFAGTLRAVDWNLNLGTITATSSDFQRAARLDIDIVSGGQPSEITPRFVNAGTIATNPMGELAVHAGTPGATLVNLGLISIAGHATFDADIIGTGTIRLEAAIPLHGFTATPDITTTAGVDTGQTIQFMGGNVLHINDLDDFHGLISGFDGTPTAGAFDRIELTGHDITGSVWRNNGSEGSLTLLEGNSVAGELRFAGTYASDSFTLSHLDLHTATGVTHTTTITVNNA